jgi:site-specific DNA-adenine methylase
MSTELQRVTPIHTVHRQTAMETVSSSVTKIASKFYFKNQFSHNEQIRLLGQFSPTHDKHERPRSL